MERIMRQHLLDRFGVAVELGTELLSFDQTADGVTCRLGKVSASTSEITEETMQVQYLIGTDGGKSTVRKHLGVSFLGETRAEDAIIYGDVVVKGLDRDVSMMLLFGLGDAG
jgi:2-polyprenyl-6-methoxyphenol hydroxylase-like FAD-dependent oxidoreductase